MADYSNERLNPACFGRLADTSDYNIDGACVAGEELEFGQAVYVDSIVDGMKVIRALTGDKVPYGITFFSHFEQVNGKIPEGEVVNVVSHGRIWTRSALDTAPALFSKLKFNESGQVDGAGSFATNWTFAGGLVRAGELHAIEVQVLQNANVVSVAPPVVLVSSATLAADKQSPQPNTAPVNISVTVKPDNATDKTGVYSLDGDAIATIDQTGKLTPKGGEAFGNIKVTWTANDASKTKATMDYRFEKPADILVTGADIAVDKEVLKVGETAQATSTAKPSNATNKGGVFSSADPNVFTVTPEGVIKAVNAGIANLVWTANDAGKAKAQKAITVEAA